MNTEDIYNWIYENQERIRADIQAQNSNARNIATLYNMLIAYKDSPAIGLLQAAVANYRKEIEENE